MVRPGEIYYVDWSPGRDFEQKGVRPAVIIQNDVGNRLSSTTIVAAVSTRRRSPFPFQVGISPEESGLPRDSVVKCEQIQTVDQARLGKVAGAFGEETMELVGQALHLSLGLEHYGPLTRSLS